MEQSAVEWIAEMVRLNPLMSSSEYNKLLEQAIMMAEQEKVEFAFRAYGEKLSTGKDFVDIVNERANL